MRPGIETMTVQLRPAITNVIAGTLATAAILTQAPQASASLAAASLIATNTDTAPLTLADCDPASHGTILSDATESIAALGTDNPLAQASVLLAGLGCLTGGSLWLKRQLP